MLIALWWRLDRTVISHITGTFIDKQRIWSLNVALDFNPRKEYQSICVQKERCNFKTVKKSKSLLSNLLHKTILTSHCTAIRFCCTQAES